MIASVNSGIKSGQTGQNLAQSLRVGYAQLHFEDQIEQVLDSKLPEATTACYFGRNATTCLRQGFASGQLRVPATAWYLGIVSIRDFRAGS
jgi:hypothetical protein